MPGIVLSNRLKGGQSRYSGEISFYRILSSLNISTYESRSLPVPWLREKENPFTVFYFEMLGLWHPTCSDIFRKVCLHSSIC